MLIYKSTTRTLKGPRDSSLELHGATYGAGAEMGKCLKVLKPARPQPMSLK